MTDSQGTWAALPALGAAAGTWATLPALGPAAILLTYAAFLRRAERRRRLATLRLARGTLLIRYNARQGIYAILRIRMGHSAARRAVAKLTSKQLDEARAVAKSLLKLTLDSPRSEAEARTQEGNNWLDAVFSAALEES